MTRSDKPTVRRQFLKAAGAAGITALAGCNGDGGDGDGGGGDTTAVGDGGSGGKTIDLLYFSGQSTQEHRDNFKQIVKAWGDETGNTVNIQSIGQAGQMAQKSRTQIESGEAPDIIMLNALPLQTFAAEGFLEPIDDYLSKADFSMDDFVRRKPLMASRDGKHWGVPCMSGHWGVLYYNADVMREAGYDPMEPNWKDWDSWLEVGRGIKKEVGINPIGMVGADNIHTTVQWSGFYFTSGERSWLKIPEGDDSPPWENLEETMLDKQPGLDAGKLVERAVKDELVPEGAVNMTGADMRELLKASQTWSYQSGSWVANGFKEQDPGIDWGVHWNPQHPDGGPAGFSGGWFWVVPSDSQKKDTAWDLAARLSTVESQKKYTQLPPARIKGVEDHFEGFKDGLGRDVGHIFTEELKNTGFPTIHKKAPDMWNKHRSEIQNIFLGKKSGEQAMKDAASAIEESF